jgi:hypothetical protein
VNETRACYRAVYQGNGFGRRCRNPAKMQYQGSWYCSVHDPVKRIEKLAEAARLRSAAIACRVAERERQQALAAARQAVIDAAKAWAAPPAQHKSYGTRMTALCDAVEHLNKLEAKPADKERPHMLDLKGIFKDGEYLP